MALPLPHPPLLSGVQSLLQHARVNGGLPAQAGGRLPTVGHRGRVPAQPHALGSLPRRPQEVARHWSWYESRRAGSRRSRAAILCGTGCSASRSQRCAASARPVAVCFASLGAPARGLIPLPALAGCCRVLRNRERACTRAHLLAYQKLRPRSVCVGRLLSRRLAPWCSCALAWRTPVCRVGRSPCIPVH